MPNVLMVGYNSGLASLFKDSSDLSCYLIEEEEVVRAREESFADAPMTGLRFGAYQQSEGFLDVTRQWHQEVRFDAVVAGLEYAVPGVELFAAEMGLRSVGFCASRACTNKIRLRELCRSLPIDQPRFAAARSADDVRTFMGDVPVILKPADRQASLGVVRIDDISQVDGAWMESTGADEGSRIVSRDLRWEYIVEEFVDGPQISVESLVDDGTVIFHNPTLASTFGGDSFAEVGHVVPAPLPPSRLEPLLSATTTLLAGMDARHGVFHSEWKLSERGPVLLECAARAPGDLLPQLIERAYGFNFYGALVDILLGRSPRPPREASRVAGVQFFRPPPGRFVALDGLSELAECPEVFDYFVNLTPGEPTPSLRDSFSRAGYYAFSSDDLAGLTQVTEHLADALEFVVSPLAP